MIKKILLALVTVVALIIVVLGIASFLTTTDLKSERSIVINKPKTDVFAYAKMLKNQNEWGPWFKKDPSMKQEFVGTDGTVGFISKWDSTSEEVGAGEQEIKRIVEGERIDTELRFKRPFESKADAYFITEDAGNSQTKVTWGFDSEMPRPFNLMSLFVDMDAMVGKDFQEGLNNMKAILEKP